MTCTACGDKPKNTAKDFTKAVIEINNPEQLVLLRKVVVPATMGDDTEVPAAIGKYRNVLLKYEANNHIYLYSSDGIPTLLEMPVPDEVWNRISTLEEGLANEIEARTSADNELSDQISALSDDLADEVQGRQEADEVIQQEIDDLKNNPDVVDIVDTYEDLMEYDTSALGDKDIIRVLRDETHEGQSDYYRWSTATETWTFIGTVGDYYTKQQVDELLDTKQDELTPGENISIVDESGELVISATDTTYSAGSGLTLDDTTFSVDTTTIQPRLTAGSNITISGDTISATDTTYTAGTNVNISSGNVISATDTTYSPFTGTNGTSAGTSGLVPAPATTDAGKVLGANGSWVTGGPNVVQTTGTSTTDVMSQNAVTSMVFADPSANREVRIGAGSASSSTNTIAVGPYARATYPYSTAIVILIVSVNKLSYYRSRV